MATAGAPALGADTRAVLDRHGYASGNHRARRITASDIADLARTVRDGVRDGSFSAREVAEAFTRAVSAAKELNAFLVETPEHALAAAAAADTARASGETLKPLAGLIFADAG
mgnify:CR=1 FL=1